MPIVFKLTQQAHCHLIYWNVHNEMLMERTWQDNNASTSLVTPEHHSLIIESTTQANRCPNRYVRALKLWSSRVKQKLNVKYACVSLLKE